MECHGHEANKALAVAEVARRWPHLVASNPIWKVDHVCDALLCGLSVNYGAAPRERRLQLQIAGCPYEEGTTIIVTLGAEYSKHCLLQPNYAEQCPVNGMLETSTCAPSVNPSVKSVKQRAARILGGSRFLAPTPKDVVAGRMLAVQRRSLKGKTPSQVVEAAEDRATAALAAMVEAEVEEDTKTTTSNNKDKPRARRNANKKLSLSNINKSAPSVAQLSRFLVAPPPPEPSPNST